MKLIGITGKAGAGKDTLAAGFVRLGYRRIAFADALKEAAAVIAGEPSGPYFTHEGKVEFSPVLGRTRREALQSLGSAVRSHLDEGVWVRRALAEWERLGRPATVISDVRYDNEAQKIRDLGGMVIRIDRPGPALLSGAAAAHESEHGVCVDLVDEVFVNDGDIDDVNAYAAGVADWLAGVRA